MTPRPPEWRGRHVRVRDDVGDEWWATVVRAWVGARTRRLTRVVLRWGAGEARADHRRRVLRTEPVAGAPPLVVLGGAW